VIERDLTEFSIVRLGFDVKHVTAEDFDEIADGISPADRYDLGRTWRNDWRAELRATLQNASEAYMFHRREFPFAGVYGVTAQGHGKALIWLLQSETFLTGAEAVLGVGWAVRFTAATRDQLAEFIADYGTLFNFIPVSQTTNIRWLKGCGFTFHTHPDIETDMRLFTLGPDGDRLAGDTDFWANYLGTDFADIWGE
jgi:hypothetical protein